MKKGFIWFLCLVLALGSLTLTPQTVRAEDGYIVDMNEKTNISVTADDTVWGKDGKIITYIVFTKSVTCTNRVTVKGNVRLCLYHGNTLNMTKGITVPKGSKDYMTDEVKTNRKKSLRNWKSFRPKTGLQPVLIHPTANLGDRTKMYVLFLNNHSKLCFSSL